MKFDVKAALERSYRRHYEEVIASEGRTGPAWEELTDEQRATIRTEIDRYRKEMQDFGASLRGEKP